MEDTENKPVAEVREEIKKHQEKFPPIVKEEESVIAKNTEGKKAK